jgi:hypothetical protein
MPKATVSVEPEMHSLKSCEGGWVKLRRMSYGERLHRTDIAMTMSMQQDQRAKTGKMEIKQAQTQVGAFEFNTCIIDHNLEKDDGQPLNFKNGQDFALLDGRIGEEISALIEEMHDWEATLPNSGEKYTPSSSVQGVVLRPDQDQTLLRGDWQRTS